jgi:hypothetical protein
VAVRPNITLSVKRLIRDVAERLPDLAHVRPSSLLVVAGEARGLSRASIGPASARRGKGKGKGKRRFLRVGGRRVLYVMTLRPLWFMASTPEERVATVLHELYHCSQRFDGKLDGSRKHARMPRRAYDARIQELLGRYLAHAPQEVLAPFAHEGVVRVRMWLRRPSRGALVASGGEAENDLFYGYMPLHAVDGSARRRRRRAARRPRGVGA